MQIRHLQVDLSQGFSRHWLGGDAFRTQLFNAQSMSFPLGEQYFIDSVRAALPQVSDPALREEIRVFIGQEAVHRQVHARYNAILEEQGLNFILESYIAWRIRCSKYASVLDNLAVTMAYEHYTSIFSDGTLGETQWIADAEEPLKTLWQWHAVEETEHKAVAFDTYHAIGGGYLRRIGWFLYVSLLFTMDTWVQTLHNLYRDRSLFKLRTWGQMGRYLFQKNGLLRFTLPRMLAFFHPRFHPWQYDNRDLAESWLRRHRVSFRTLGEAA